MFYKKNWIRLVGVIMMLCGWTNSFAFEASDLPALRDNMIAACPVIWEPIHSRVLYINGQDTALIAGVEYESGMDIWHASRTDKVRYIAYAYQVLAPHRNNLVMDHASTDGAVITACSNARRDYFETLIQTYHVDPLAAQTILDTVRDDDHDGIFNHADECLFTTNVGVPEGTGEHSIDSDYEVDASGCAAWERDTDGDEVSDHYDYCEFDLEPEGTTIASDGCKDSDDDGESDRIDTYPHQNDTQCTP